MNQSFEKVVAIVHEEVRLLLHLIVTPEFERYNNRKNQYTQNPLFESNQNFFFYKLEARKRGTVMPDVEGSRNFWSDIWDCCLRHSKNTD